MENYENYIRESVVDLEMIHRLLIVEGILLSKLSKLERLRYAINNQGIVVDMSHLNDKISELCNDIEEIHLLNKQLHNIHVVDFYLYRKWRSRVDTIRRDQNISVKDEPVIIPTTDIQAYIDHMINS